MEAVSLHRGNLSHLPTGPHHRPERVLGVWSQHPRRAAGHEHLPRAVLQLEALHAECAAGRPRARHR